MILGKVVEFGPMLTALILQELTMPKSWLYLPFQSKSPYYLVPLSAVSSSL